MVKRKYITKIEKQKRNNGRYNVYIDDEYMMSVHEDVLVSQELYKGKEVTEDDFETILMQEERQKIWRKSLSYLSYRPRTTFEMEQYLQKKEYHPERIAEVITKLEQEKLLDDVAYAEKFIEERIQLKHKGRRLIKLELKNKGIRTEIIEQIFAETNEEEEYHAAKALLEKNLKKYSKWTGLEKKRKLGQLLSRRGFSYDIINKVLSEYV